MRLFKSRKSGEYNDVSSVVANENDPHVKIVSCSSQQEFHSNIENGCVNKTIKSNECPSTNGHFEGDNNDDDGDGDGDDQKKLCASFNQIHNHSIRNQNNIPYGLKKTDNNHCNDKFTPIPDCDKFDEPVSASAHNESSSNNSSTTATAAAVAKTTMMTTTITASTAAIGIDGSGTAIATNIPETLSDSTSDFINELFGMFGLTLHWVNCCYCFICAF